MRLRNFNWLACGIYVLCFLSACAGIEKPDAWFGGINARSGTWRAYNIKHDFDSEGNRLPGAKPRITPITLESLNGFQCTDPTSFERILVTLKQTRDALRRCEAKSNGTLVPEGS